MIFITARFRVRPEHADDWATITADFTRATRAEPGCLWFDWSRGLDDPNEYVLVEAFRDDEAGGAHVQSDHFATARRTLPRYLAETPRIVNATVDQDDWSELGEMAVPQEN
jgi:quinol monooxygenase YgiN